MREVPFGKLNLRVRAARGVDVTDQRQDRVVIRRESQLCLSAISELAVFRDDAANPLQLRSKQNRLVVFGEVAVLALELGQPWIGLYPHGIAPGEAEPHLEVADVGVSELCIRGSRCQLEIPLRLLNAQRPG